MFTEGMKVSTPKGDGYITLLEDDDYMIVEIRRGEFEFWAPFKDVTEWVDPVEIAKAKEAEQVAKLTETIDILIPFFEQREEPIITLGKLSWLQAYSVSQIIPGANCAHWDELSTYQKANYCALGSGQSLHDVIIKMLEEFEAHVAREKAGNV